MRLANLVYGEWPISWLQSVQPWASKPFCTLAREVNWCECHLLYHIRFTSDKILEGVLSKCARTTDLHSATGNELGISREWALVFWPVMRLSWYMHSTCLYTAWDYYREYLYHCWFTLQKHEFMSLCLQCYLFKGCLQQHSSNSSKTKKRGYPYQFNH